MNRGEDGRTRRPFVLRGTTVSGDTPMGRLNMIVNRDNNNDPFELFLTASKGGSETAAIAEALGRLCSFVLRIDPSSTPTERLHGITSQLRDIGGPRSRNGARSLPDGLAMLLEEYLGVSCSSEERLRDLCPGCGFFELQRVGDGTSCNRCG
jgi:ribonucleoside-diphosphate reductase alpha chain